MRRFTIISIMIALAVVSQVKADCIQNMYGKVLCGRGKCLSDMYGRVICAPYDGGILKDIHGNILCGFGHCAMDYRGEVWCSIEQDGSVGTDRYGNVLCFGGCERGKMEICQDAQQPW
jgi:hypothetical protein